MRRLTRLLVVLPASLLLAAPLGSAHAAKANPWSAYFPAKGVTCTSTMTHADGTTETAHETVVSKTLKKVVTRVAGTGLVTSLLLPGGRLEQTSHFSQRAAGMQMQATLAASYPSPTKLLHHGRGSATFTMRMTMPKDLADVAVAHGRTLTLTGSYRISGVGTRTVALGDPAATSVETIGVRTAFRSLRITNAKPAFQRQAKKSMRPLFASMAMTEWMAPGHGTVRTDAHDEDGTAMTVTQVGCA